VPDAHERSFTLTDDASSRTVAAAYRAALVAQRDRLRLVSIDVLSDRPWPADVQRAVDALRAKIRPHRVGLLRKRLKTGITINVDPRDVETFDEVVAIAPYSIGGTGISMGNRIIWSGNDTGTSFAAKLTSEEERVVRLAIADGGGDPDHLVLMTARRDQRRHSS
jgi:hypothetical protein